MPVARPARVPALVVATVLTAGVLTACSPPSSPAAPPSSAPPSSAAAAYPMTLTSAFGETVLEAKPERIVAVGVTADVDNLLALGVSPVAAPASSLSWPWAKPKATQVQSTWDDYASEELPFETILAADPDLIVAVSDELDKQTYDRLAQIAPVLADPDSDGSGGAAESGALSALSWKESLRHVAKPLDLAGRAEEVILDVEKRIGAVKQANPGWAGKTATLAVHYGPQYGTSYFSYAGSPAEDLLISMGLAPNPLAKEFSAQEVAVTPEQFELLEADVLLMTFRVDAAEQAAFEKQKLLQQLTVVKDGGYLVVPNAEDGSTPIAWALRTPNALNLTWSLDTLTPLISQGLNGK